MNDWQAALEEWQKQQALAAQQQPPPSDPVDPNSPGGISPSALGLPPAQQFLGDQTGTGPNGQDGNPIQTSYTGNLYASYQDASDLAKQLGGTVISAPLREAGGGTSGSPYGTPNANYIQLPNGSVVNAGTIQTYANEHPGVPLSQNQNIQQEIAKSTPGAMGHTGEDAWYQQNIANDNLPGSAAWQAQAATMPPADKKLNGVTAPPAAPVAPPPPATPASSLPPAIPPPAAPPATPPTPPANTPPPSTDPPPQVSGGDKTITDTLPGGYPGASNPGPMSGGSGALGAGQWDYKNSNNPADILANDRSYAYTQGQNLISNYGQGMASQDERGRTMGAVGDGLYAWMAANPGYTTDQASAIMDQQGLDKLNWTPDMASSNFLTQQEQAGIQGDPNAALNTYNGQVEGLRQGARNYGGQLNGVYDNGATDLNTANGAMSQQLNNSIDPAALGLSADYQQNYNFGPDQQQAMIDDAGRTVGEGTKAVTDQLERQANSSGMNSPLAMAAAEDRQRQTGAVASADAMTKAKIQAAALGLSTEQTKEQTRLGSEQDIANRRMQAATTTGQSNQANQQFLTSGRAGAALQTGQAQLNESNTIANQQTQLTGAADIAAQQRAQAIAQNRQQTNQSNQTSQFTRDSYADQAQSQRATQDAGAQRADLTAARQDTRNEEQTAYNESNSRMAGQLQAFGNTTGAGQASEQNAITASQLPTTLTKVIGGAVNSFAEGGVVGRPTLARVGEDGPEMVIKLRQPMSYRRRNEVAYA